MTMKNNQAYNINMANKYSFKFNNFTCHNHLDDREMANKIDTNIGISILIFCAIVNNFDQRIKWIYDFYIK